MQAELSEELAPPHPACITKYKEPGALRLIRSAAKAFSRGGDDQAGCYYDFNLFSQPYLEEYNIFRLPLTRFCRNRFNVIFFEAEYLFFLREKIIEFLHRYDGKNRLLTAVGADFYIPFHVAGLKTLGLVSTLITGPLWRVLEAPMSTSWT